MCGLFGIINQEPRKFDRRAFITLGCANDSRGGDACGVFIDGFAEYGTEKDDTYFQCWFKKSQQLFLHSKVKVALGHCRKASVGGKTADKAQPVVIKDEFGNTEFCVIHNGTIYNYEELAKKYIPEVDIKDMSDSQVMARIFYYAGYDCLAEYRGGAAFVIVDYRDNTVKMFKGASLSTTYAAAKVEEERPLYFAEIGEEGIVFSSLLAPLLGLYFDKEVYSVPENTLCLVENGTLYSIKEYDRTKCYQSKPTYTSTALSTLPSTTTTNTTRYSHYYDDDYYDGFDWENYYNTPDVTFDFKSGKYFERIPGPKKEMKLAHGKLTLSKSGYKCVGGTCDYYKDYYFWKGILLQGKNAYEVIEEVYNKDTTKPAEAFYLALIFAYTPVMINGKFYSYDKEFGKDPWVGFYDFPFTEFVVTFGTDGKITHKTQARFAQEHTIIGLEKSTYEKVRDKYAAHLQRKRGKIHK